VMAQIQKYLKKSFCEITKEDIQKIAGALQGQRGKKGIFITGYFSREAKEYTNKIDS
jgi:restriction system protein